MFMAKYCTGIYRLFFLLEFFFSFRRKILGLHELLGLLVVSDENIWQEIVQVCYMFAVDIFLYCYDVFLFIYCTKHILMKLCNHSMNNTYLTVVALYQASLVFFGGSLYICTCKVECENGSTCFLVQLNSKPYLFYIPPCQYCFKSTFHRGLRAPIVIKKF